MVGDSSKPSSQCSSARHDDRRERFDLRLLLARRACTLALLRLANASRARRVHQRRRGKRPGRGWGRCVPVCRRQTGGGSGRLGLALLLRRARRWYGLVDRPERSHLRVREAGGVVGEDDDLSGLCGCRWRRAEGGVEGGGVGGHGGERYCRVGSGETVDGPWGCQGRREARAGLAQWWRGNESGDFGNARMIESFEQANLVVDRVRIQGYKRWRRREGRRRFERLRAIVASISDNRRQRKKQQEHIR